MTAIAALSYSAAALLVRAARRAGANVARGLNRIVLAVKNRHTAFMLARLDDRMLADIGLTRSDLRDAYAGPPWQDPTRVLAQRAAERRRRRLGRRRAAFERSAELHSDEQQHFPPADRPACYLS